MIRNQCPPEDVEPSELWLKLCEALPSEVVDFPRKDKNGNPVGKVRIQVLKMEDHNKARLLATKALPAVVKEMGLGELSKNELDSEAVKEVLGDLIAHELLCMACYSDKAQPGMEDSDGNPIYARVFTSPNAIRSKLTADETLVLFNAYRIVQYKYGPFENSIQSDEELEAWIQRLKEGGSAFPLLVLPLPQLAELTYCLSEKISSLCQILESQRSSLPDTLVSSLRDCFTGTLLFGEPLNESIQILGETLPKTVDLSTALKLAQEHKDSVNLGS